MNKIDLKSSERIDDLTSVLKIIQSREVFSFSIDAILLAHFSTVPKNGNIVDLCSGNGVIPLLLSQKTKASIYGVEIQDRLVDMSLRSIEINNLTNQINIINENIKEAPKLLGKDKFDLVTVNPPYMPINGQDKNINIHFAIARHEILTDLRNVINISSQLLKVGGKLAMVHRASRFADIIMFMRNEKLEPKRTRFVHPSKSKEANMVLVEAIKHGGTEMHVLPPLIIYKDKEEYSDEVYQMYYGDSNG